MEAPVAFKWPPLESNPEVFTEYLHKLGVPEDVVVGEVFGLDEDSLSFVPRPVYAVIATFEALKKNENPNVVDSAAQYYMHQTSNLDNACGIIASIHSVLNNLDKFQLTEGGILDRFYKSVQALSP